MKQARSYEGERLALEIRIRAERKAGAILIEMGSNGKREKRSQGGNRKSLPHDGAMTPTLKDLGVSPKEAENWQKLAKVPERQFEAALADPAESVTGDGFRVAFPGWLAAVLRLGGLPGLRRQTLGKRRM